MSTKKRTEQPKTPMEELLGDSLATNEKGAKTPTVSAFKDKDLVALYFSAKWCPPCRAFSPVLKDFYKACAEKGKLEIVYVSSDKSLNEWQEYYGSMPWLSLPEGAASGATGSCTQIKNNLATKLKISGIPTLIVLEVKTGKFVTAAARDDVTSSGGNPEKGMEVIEAWKAVDPVPIEQADLTPPGPSGIFAFLMMILKNPIYIFGLLYFYRRFMKYLQEANIIGGDAEGGAMMEDDVPDLQQQDTEF